MGRKMQEKRQVGIGLVSRLLTDAQLQRGMPLSKRRRWGADDAPGDDSADGTAPQADPVGANVKTPAEAEKTGDDKREQFIPRERFDQVNNRAKELEQQVADMKAKEVEAEKAKTEADEERLKEQNKFEELYNKTKVERDELLPYKEQIEGLKKQVAESNKARIEKVPERMRGLIPESDDSFEVQAYLDKNADVLNESAPVPDTDAGVSGDRTGPPPAKMKPKARF